MTTARAKTAIWDAPTHFARGLALHRLNRTEYANAIRDLLALEVDGKSLLTADEPDQQSFDNIASVLTVSPVLAGQKSDESFGLIRGVNFGRIPRRSGTRR